MSGGGGRMRKCQAEEGERENVRWEGRMRGGHVGRGVGMYEGR